MRAQTLMSYLPSETLDQLQDDFDARETTLRQVVSDRLAANPKRSDARSGKARRALLVERSLSGLRWEEPRAGDFSGSLAGSSGSPSTGRNSSTSAIRSRFWLGGRAWFVLIMVPLWVNLTYENVIMLEIDDSAPETLSAL